MNPMQEQLRIRGRLVRLGSLESDGFNYLHDAVACVETLRMSDPSIDIFTFVQTLPHTERECAYAMELDNFAALPVSTYEKWWTSQIDNKTRNMVRKSEKKGLVVREVPFDDTFVSGIFDIYNETPVRQGKQFWHYGKDFSTIRRENGSFRDQSVYIGAFFGHELVGFVKLVVDQHGGQAAMMQILSMTKHRDKAPTNALIAQVVRSCSERHIPYAVYAKLFYGKKHHDSLVTFKLSNGFERIEVPRYYVPFTVRGSLALRLGFHRRLSERLPEGVLGGIRRLRRLWYERRPVAHVQRP
jgi:hypothetical protein